MKKYLMLTCTLAVLFSCNNATTKSEDNTSENLEQTISTQKIVSLNGSISEVLVALGYESNIIGRDVTSTYPTTLKDKAKDLGHTMSITAEPILELKPDVIFAGSKDLKPELMEQLTKAGITVEIIDQDYSIDGTKNFIKTIAEKLGNENYQTYLDAIDTKIKEVQPISKKPKVLFIYARGAGTLMIAGNNTPVKSMIELAGGENAVNNIYEYKPLTPEALVNANPDYILLFDTGLQSLGGVEGVLKIEGVAATNTGKNKKIIAMDGQFLSGFGPRVADAVVELNQLIQQ